MTSRHRQVCNLVYQALILDYGGVLTRPLHHSFHAFETEIGVPTGTCVRLLVDASRTTGGGVIGEIERGDITEEEFDRRLRDLLNASGHHVPNVPLITGLFREATPDGALWDVVQEVRHRNVTTALLSNSWGRSLYPFDRITTAFDEVVISEDVGLRKPDPAIYQLMLDRLDVPASACVFVDDLPKNVDAARDLGIHAVWHDGDHERVAVILREIFRTV